MKVSNLVVVAAAMIFPCCRGSVNTTTLKIGLLGMMSRSWLPVRLGRLGAALPISLEDAESMRLPLNHSLAWVAGESACNPQTSVANFVTLVQEDNVDVIIGPACSTACTAVNYLASAWNVPQISFVCGAENLSNKQHFSTFLRTASTYGQDAEALIHVVKTFSWSKAGFLTMSNMPLYEMLRVPLIDMTEDHNITISWDTYDWNYRDRHESEAAVRDVLGRFLKHVRGR